MSLSSVDRAIATTHWFHSIFAPIEKWFHPSSKLLRGSPNRQIFLCHSRNSFAVPHKEQAFLTPQHPRSADSLENTGAELRFSPKEF
jgi:hypothetical protein